MARRDKKQSVKRRRDYRGKQRSTSVFFLLWTVFTALSLLIVLFFGLTQRAVMTQAYKSEAVHELREKSVHIKRAVEQDVPPEFEDNKSLYLRVLSTSYDVNIFILDVDGEVLFPQFPHVDGEEKPDVSFDFSEEIVTLKDKLGANESVIYEGEEEYVYGSKIKQFGEDAYLYIGKSLSLVQATSEEMGARMLLMAVFISILAFAVSFAVSGWLIKPLTEMTEKAHRLAKGDFRVDFRGSDYGREMVELADTLNYARDELSKTDRMQKELIANVSHDFKTPLTMIKAYASMIIEISGDNKEKREKHAQVIVDEADRLTSLVTDVLEISKMRAGLEELKFSEVDISAYLQELLGRFEYLKETQGYTFIVDTEDGLFTRGDEVKLGQALYNLISNAVNYTGEDKKVFVRLKKTGENVFRFSVQDTGAGIKEEDLPEIWDRYYRTAETHKRPVNGTGLGLSIVKTVLEKHGFAFGVESEEGKGSTFYIDFPLLTDEK